MPMIKVNCASVPRDLFESEFFGHVQGAFTGAVRDRVGRFELAGGGTLLQGIAEVRAGYYAAGSGYAEDETIYPWSNLLSLNVTGDGLLRVED